MNVNKSQHSVVATFRKEEDAKQALAALKEAGITEVAYKKIEPFGLADDLQAVEENDSLANTIESSTKVLLASDPSFSPENPERNFGASSVVLSIKLAPSKHEQALKIIDKYGGEI